MALSGEEEAVDVFLVYGLGMMRAYVPTESTVNRLDAMRASGKRIEVPKDHPHFEAITSVLKAMGLQEQ